VTTAHFDDPKVRAFMEGARIAILATTRRDGSPQLSIVSFAFLDGNIVVSTARDRAKTKNIRRDPRVTLAILRTDPLEPSARPAGQPRAEGVYVYGRAEIVDRPPEELVPLAQPIGVRAGRPEAPEALAARLLRENRIILRIAPERVVVSESTAARLAQEK